MLNITAYPLSILMHLQIRSMKKNSEILFQRSPMNVKKKYDDTPNHVRPDFDSAFYERYSDEFTNICSN